VPKNALFSIMHRLNGFKFLLLITDTIYFKGVNLVRMNVIYKVVFVESLLHGSVHSQAHGNGSILEDFLSKFEMSTIYLNWYKIYLAYFPTLLHNGYTVDFSESLW
jgi:hypothetical protein